MTTLRRASTNHASSTISLKTLIVESWKTFIRDWKESFSVSIWLLAPAVLLLAVTLLDRAIPDTLGILPLLVFVVSLCVQAWVSVHLIRDTLKRTGESISKATTWQVDVLTYVWTKFLNGVALVGSLLPLVLGIIGIPLFITLTRVSERGAGIILFGGMALLSLPAIWLAINLIFWPYILASGPEGVEKVLAPIRGRRWVSIKKTIAVLTASYELVRGRFWYTLVRLIVPGFIFGMVLLASVTIVDTVIQFIAGPAKIAALFSTSGSFIDINHSTGNAYAFFLQAVGEAVFLPLFIVWQTKLFQSLREKK